MGHVKPHFSVNFKIYSTRQSRYRDDIHPKKVEEWSAGKMHSRTRRSNRNRSELVENGLGPTRTWPTILVSRWLANSTPTSYIGAEMIEYKPSGPRLHLGARNGLFLLPISPDLEFDVRARGFCDEEAINSKVMAIIKGSDFFLTLKS